MYAQYRSFDTPVRMLVYSSNVHSYTFSLMKLSKGFFFESLTVFNIPKTETAVLYLVSFTQEKKEKGLRGTGMTVQVSQVRFLCLTRNIVKR